MPEVAKVICVECPKMEGNYITRDNCRLCPLFQRESGRIIDCGYTFKKFETEPNKLKEQVSRW